MMTRYVLHHLYEDLYTVTKVHEKVGEQVCCFFFVFFFVNRDKQSCI